MFIGMEIKAEIPKLVFLHGTNKILVTNSFIFLEDLFPFHLADVATFLNVRKRILHSGRGGG